MIQAALHVFYGRFPFEVFHTKPQREVMDLCGFALNNYFVKPVR
jgi:hypothetical protein